MYETLKQILLNDIITFGEYGINILDIALIVPIIFADFTLLRIFNKFLKKRDLLKKGFGKTFRRIVKWIVHFLAFLGVIFILGVTEASGDTVIIIT